MSRLSSMTGFAREEGGDELQTWVWEAKSVNGRGLDVRVRVPAGYESLEAEARALVPKWCTRGNVSVNLTVDRGERAMQLRVNWDMLNELIALTREIRDRVEAAPPRLDGLLAVRGVLESVEEPEEEALAERRQAAMLADLARLIEALATEREREGAKLAETVLVHLAEIARLTEEASGLAATQPEALRERLRKQVAELLESQSALGEDRLAQEAALLASKADVREELDRLKAHVVAARELLEDGGVIGRRLDFLCQELNREANTLCSKAFDVSLTRVGLALKSAIEQLREQVQNVE